MTRKNKLKQKRFTNLWRTPKLFHMLQQGYKNKSQALRLFKQEEQNRK